MAVFICLDNRVFAQEDVRGAKHQMFRETYNRPVYGVDLGPLGDQSLLDGIDRSMDYMRPFVRVDAMRAGSKHVFLYREDEMQMMPLEILSRRTQEVEAEWLRLGELLERLRRMECLAVPR